MGLGLAWLGLAWLSVGWGVWGGVGWDVMEYCCGGDGGGTSREGG
jgi:hypothetical protein